MTTPQQKVSKWFRDVPELYQTRAAKILLWGPWGTGKTFFLGTCPTPVWILDPELGAAPVMYHEFGDLIEKGQIKIAEVGVIDPDTLTIDPEQTLNNFEEALLEVLPIIEPKATLAIDSGTVVWQTLGWWLDDVAEVRYQKKGPMQGKPMRTEWAKANRRFYVWVQQMIQKKDLTVVITSHTQDVYDDSGNLSIPDGKMRINKQTPHWVDFVYHMTLANVFSWDGEGKDAKRTREQQRVAILEKCRFADMLKFTAKERQVVNLTYPKMIEQLSRLGLLFREDGTIDKPQTEEEKTKAEKAVARWRASKRG